MAENGESAGERIQKVLANAGLGSRRQIEQWIRDGRVDVNGRIAQLGDRVQPTDRVRVDGRVVHAHRLEAVERKILVYNKPEGEVVTRADPEGRKTVFESLPRPRRGRWIAVGRLDINSMGLLLLTTDGELANRLMHPSGEVEREYAVRVLGAVTPETLQRLQQGVALEDGPARFDSIVDAGGEGANHWYRVTLKEGRYREVRRLWDAVGVKVSRLKRVRFGPVSLGSTDRAGRFRDATDVERRALLALAGLPPETPEPAPRRGRPPPSRGRAPYGASKRSPGRAAPSGGRSSRRGPKP
jgi:23S rRNA pseudouridine2605 synthase